MRTKINFALLALILIFTSSAVVNAEKIQKNQSSKTVGKGSISNKRLSLTYGGRFHTHQIRMTEIKKSVK